MKRKPRLAPRNPLATLASHRKAGAHGKSGKALRRLERVQLERETGVVAAHRAFTPAKDGFESLVSHQSPYGCRLQAPPTFVWTSTVGYRSR